jgi:cation diffusion facilitator CzcD-associated flavoprotein CzcO
MSTSQDARICIVGAGPCGLTAVKNMRAAGLENVVCYDDGYAVGGNWVYNDNLGKTSVYSCTHLISSAPYSRFEDFPMPAGYPSFPSHWQMREYFEKYAAHFGLHPFIRLQTRVERATRREDGRWQISLSGAAAGEELFDYLVVCSGHHRDPLIPNCPGQFSGQTLHSADYRRPDVFRNKRVLVVGGGNSACDIAVDISGVAAHTSISMRRGYYIVPKVIYGRPVDAQYYRLRRLPRPLMEFVLRVMLRLAIGRWERYGLEPPACGPLQMHPTLSSLMLAALSDGKVRRRAGIKRLDGTTVHFSDDTSEPFDTIIWATGFRTTVPFLHPSVIDWPADGMPPLYLKMMHARIPNLFFVGFFQPLGCIWRLADHQARIAALQIVGRLDRPADIDRRIDAEKRLRERNFDPSPRHATEVLYYDFRRELFAELGRAAH